MFFFHEFQEISALCGQIESLQVFETENETLKAQIQVLRKIYLIQS